MEQTCLGSARVCSGCRGSRPCPRIPPSIPNSLLRVPSCEAMGSPRAISTLRCSLEIRTAALAWANVPSKTGSLQQRRSSPSRTTRDLRIDSSLGPTLTAGESPCVEGSRTRTTEEVRRPKSLPKLGGRSTPSTPTGAGNDSQRDHGAQSLPDIRVAALLFPRILAPQASWPRTRVIAPVMLLRKAVHPVESAEALAPTHRMPHFRKAVRSSPRCTDTSQPRKHLTQRSPLVTSSSTRASSAVRERREYAEAVVRSTPRRSASLSPDKKRCKA